ncbi:MAG: hypothetical protein AB8B46_03760 [Candidatus Midichloriaceae bacterium]
MPVSDFQEFQERYYKIISQIAVKAIDKGSLLFDDQDSSLDFFVGQGEFDDELEELESLRKMAIAIDLKTEIKDFKFELGNPLLEKDETMKIFQYFHDIDNGEKVEIDISTLDIPDISKQEIQAQGFVQAFDNMKENGKDPVDTVKFQKYYQNVQILSMQSDLLEVENPELSANLDRANGIFNNFNRVKEKYDSLEKQQNIFRDSDSDGSVSIEVPSIESMLDKADKAYDLQQGLRIKLAEYIALKKIKIFDEHGNFLENADPLPVSVIFKDTQITEELGNYLKKSASKLITDKSDVTIDKIFHALDIDGQNIGVFKKLVDKEKAQIKTPRQRESESRQSSSVESNVKPTKEQRLNGLKERLARSILEVAKVSPERITDIMTNPKMADAKAAIMKRAENTLEKLGVNEKDIIAIGTTNALKDVRNEDLQNQIKMQSEELVAQVGRVSSKSIDSQDMRGKENLHEKYQDKASKLDKGTFNKNVVKALNYEKTKDDRGKGKTFAYNAFYRKPMQLLDALRPKNDKPFFTPAKTAIAGLIALAVLAPPLGAIVGVALMCKAAKNLLYDESKLQNWVNDKLFEKPPEKESIINTEALEKVNLKSLTPEKTQSLDKPVIQEKAPEKTQTLGQTVVKERVSEEGQNLDKLEVPAKSFDRPRDKLQEMIDSNPKLRKDFEKVVSTAVKSSQQREEVLKVTKEIAGKDALGKQRPMDDLDLMSAKSRVANETRKHKGSGIGL